MEAKAPESDSSALKFSLIGTRKGHIPEQIEKKDPEGEREMASTREGGGI